MSRVGGRSFEGGWSRGGWSRAADALAHRVLVVAAVIVGLILLGARLGPDLHDTLALLASALALVWILAQFAHESRAHLCARCLAAMPVDPGPAVARGRVWLRLYHGLTDSPAGLPVYLVVLALAYLPSFLGWPGLDWLWFLPITGFTWLSLRHHAVRPWCPYCRGWDDGGDHEPSPTPDPAATKTHRA